MSQRVVGMSPTVLLPGFSLVVVRLLLQLLRDGEVLVTGRQYRQLLGLLLLLELPDTQVQTTSRQYTLFVFSFISLFFSGILMFDGFLFRPLLISACPKLPLKLLDPLCARGRRRGRGACWTGCWRRGRRRSRGM